MWVVSSYITRPLWNNRPPSTTHTVKGPIKRKWFRILLSFFTYLHVFVKENLYVAYCPLINFSGEKGDKGSSGTGGPPGGSGKSGQKGTNFFWLLNGLISSPDVQQFWHSCLYLARWCWLKSWERWNRVARCQRWWCGERGTWPEWDRWWQRRTRSRGASWTPRSCRSDRSERRQGGQGGVWHFWRERTERRPRGYGISRHSGRDGHSRNERQAWLPGSCGRPWGSGTFRTARGTRDSRTSGTTRLKGDAWAEGGQRFPREERRAGQPRSQRIEGIGGSPAALSLQRRHLSKKVLPSLWLADPLRQSLLQPGEPLQRHFQQLHMRPRRGLRLLLPHHCAQSASARHAGRERVTAGEDAGLSVRSRHRPGVLARAAAAGGGRSGVDGNAQRLERGVRQQWGWQHLLRVPALLRHSLILGWKRLSRDCSRGKYSSATPLVTYELLKTCTAHNVWNFQRLAISRSCYCTILSHYITCYFWIKIKVLFADGIFIHTVSIHSTLHRYMNMYPHIDAGKWSTRRGQLGHIATQISSKRRSHWKYYNMSRYAKWQRFNDVIKLILRFIFLLDFSKPCTVFLNHIRCMKCWLIVYL